MTPYVGEFLGTFALVFAGTGAIVVNDVSGGVIGHAGIALTFGLMVMTMIYAVGDISGAHLHPAVSFGFWVAKRLSLRDVGLFSLSQISGAIPGGLSGHPICRLLRDEGRCLVITDAECAGET